jgi:ABC-type ATPase involved in cell division
MSAPLSIRFDTKLLERLRRRAQSTPGSTPSGLAQRLVDEGLRMAEHPGIVFKDGPSGRRAALAFGPDAWEIVKVLREIDERGPTAITATADVLALAEAKVRVVMHYYAAYPAEIDAEIEEADRISTAAQAAWEAEQRLLR